MHCFACDVDVIGGVVMHEQSYHNGAQTCWMSPTEQTSTIRVHRFGAGGCVNQWHADHDDADCYRAFKAEQEAERFRTLDPEPLR
jgi:hypothetical protein